MLKHSSPIKPHDSCQQDLLLATILWAIYQNIWIWISNELGMLKFSFPNDHDRSPLDRPLFDWYRSYCPFQDRPHFVFILEYVHFWTVYFWSPMSVHKWRVDFFWPPTFDIFEIFVNVIDRMTSQWWCSVSFSDNLESGLSQREGEIRLKKQKSYFVDPINSFDSHGQSKKAIFTQKPLEFRISYFCWHFWFQPNFLSRTSWWHK